MSDPVLLYDGACGFCAESVQLVLRHEGREYATTPGAIRAARDHLERDGVLRAAGQPAPVPAPTREAP